MIILEGRRCSATKININFFVRNKVLNISYIIIFSKKHYFPKQLRKITFERLDNFSGNGVLDDKNEHNLFPGKWDTEYGFEIFSSKNTTPAEWKPKIQFWGHIFPHINGSTGPIVSIKNRVHPCVDSNQPCEFCENWFKIVTCNVKVIIIIISWKSSSVIF